MMRFVMCVMLMVGLTAPFGMANAQDTPMSKEKNPYTGDPAMAKEGRGLYFYFSCNACHGGMGGGGMAGCPPLFDDEWNYGGEDKTLFKLLQGEIPDQIMPNFGGAITTDEVWKLVTWIRSIYKGDPSKVVW